MAFILPELNYDYNDLEPYIDAMTMRIHHENHHSTYLDKFNRFIGNSNLEDYTITEMFKNVSALPEEIRNFGGGFFNHSFFWKILSPEKSELKDQDLMDELTKYFGSINDFKKIFKGACLDLFGSGWVWLIQKNSGELLVTSTRNQDNPCMDVSLIRGKPLLCIDLWEHAYYLKYKNNKEAYIDAFWNVVNWEKVSCLYNESKAAVLENHK